MLQPFDIIACHDPELMQTEMQKSAERINSHVNLLNQMTNQMNADKKREMLKNLEKRKMKG